MPVEIRPIGRSLESTSAHPFHEGDRRNELEKSTTAIRRWQNLSGRDAVRESDGSSERSFPGDALTGDPICFIITKEDASL